MSHLPQFQNESCGCIIFNIEMSFSCTLAVHCLQTHDVHCQTHFLRIIWKGLCTPSRFETEAKVTRKWFIKQGRVVRKAVNANPELKVNRGSNFSYMKMYSTADVLCSLTLLKLRTEGQTI